MEESLIEKYLAGESVRRIEEWRNRPITGEYPYVFVDGIYLKRSWGSEMTSVSVLVAIGVAEDGYREILGPARVQARARNAGEVSL